MVKLANHFGHSLHLDFSGQSWKFTHQKIGLYCAHIISLLLAVYSCINYPLQLLMERDF